jgi:hypothetical protein
MNPLEMVKSHWVKKIQMALEEKKKGFGDFAEEAMKFFTGPYDFLYGLKESNQSGDFVYAGTKEMPRPSFCMTLNKVAEAVQIFGPVLYHRNPVRTVTPRKQPELPPEIFGDMNDPMVQAQQMAVMMQMQQSQSADAARGALLAHYLNWTPTALDLKKQARRGIDECIIKGMGVCWTEPYKPEGAPWKMVGSFYDTVDNLVIDPDLESLEDAKWIARRCVHPAWQVEMEYGLAPGSLKGNHESREHQSALAAKGDLTSARAYGRSNDLIAYWKIYSKMGLGGMLSGVAPEVMELEKFGPFVYLVVCDGYPYPLNLPEQTWGNDELMAQAVQWETPYWADGAWPMTPLIFHEVPRKVWPMSHMRPAMGELKFLNWAYSFIASKIGVACRDFIVCKKSLGEELKRTLLSGADYELMEMPEVQGSISDAVQFLQHPNFNGDIWKVIEAIEANFEKRVGLTELMYGQTAVQMRSASEAQVKADQLRVRPDDMANKVEDWMTDLARKEALAARWHLEPQDVMPVLGQTGAQMWQALVTPTDPSVLLNQLEYRIEAGSAKKPNKERHIQEADNAMTTLFTPLFQYGMQTGDVRPVNAILEDWAKAHDLDPAKYMISPPPLPPPMPAEGGVA